MTTETLPLTGSHTNGSTSIEWAMPVWSEWDAMLCKVGLHSLTRKPVVTGYIQYFTRVERHYCCCGRLCWVWFEDGLLPPYRGGAASHLHWINGHIEMQEAFTKHRAWERLMSEARAELRP